MDLETQLRTGAYGGYTHVLPFAWMLPTYYATPPGKPQPAAGAPLLELSDPDLQARAQRLINVLYWTAQTYANSEGMQDPRTLKIFLAPEFAFRKGAQAEGAGNDPGFGAYADSARYELAEALYRAIRVAP